MGKDRGALGSTRASSVGAAQLTGVWSPSGVFLTKSIYCAQNRIEESMLLENAPLLLFPGESFSRQFFPQKILPQD